LAHRKESLPGAADALREIIERQGGSFPHQLAQRFPRVLEKIVSAWPTPAEAWACFQELLLTERESRLGFPREIYSEILALSDFYNSLNPPPERSADDYWNWIRRRPQAE
jgi:hypothetical protein